PFPRAPSEEAAVSTVAAAVDVETGVEAQPSHHPVPSAVSSSSSSNRRGFPRRGTTVSPFSFAALSASKCHSSNASMGPSSPLPSSSPPTQPFSSPPLAWPGACPAPPNGRGIRPATP
ncbi:unnamed protein product, partial [Ectocarpus sp. 12 AP-2014]